MKRIVFFIGGLNFGGMERVVFIAKELLKGDYDVKIVTLYQDNADYEKDANYYNLDVPPSPKKMTTMLKRLVKTLKMIRKLKPDIIFSFGMYLNYLSVCSKYLCLHKATRVVGIRSYDWMTDPFFSAKIDKWIMRHADKVSSVSKLIALDAEKIWGISRENNQVLYNPYNIQELVNQSKGKIDDFTFDDQSFYISTMGRLADQKAYNHLIRAVDIVVKKHKNIKLIIMGNGDRKECLIEMIKEYQLEDNIFLIGGKSSPLRYVSRTNLYVLSSLAEGFPNALSEAMCIGIPVVSVNCKSGPSEILMGKEKVNFDDKDFYVTDYGILAKEVFADNSYRKKEANDEERALANAIEFAYENMDLMMNNAQKAKEHMKEYSYQRFYENLRELLKE